MLTSALAKNWVNGVFAQSAYAKQMRAAKYLHTNACGDFTMLSREAWFALRGYAEFAVWPTHLDSVLCYAAYHAGLREVVIPDPIRVFHIDHAQVWTPDSEEERGTRAEKLGVHLITFKTLIKYFTYMRRFNLPMIFTKDDWGLRDVELPETTL